MYRLAKPCYGRKKSEEPLLIRTVRETIQRYSLLVKGQGVVAGYSGGRDSACLVHMLSILAHEWKLRVTAVTIDHGLRPFEREKELCRRLCGELGVEHVIIHLPPGLPERAKASGMSLEHRARVERRDALKRACAQKGAERIALAHHAQDQAETLLIRLLRGTGLAGAGGMKRMTKDGVIRPLLSIEPEELTRYAEENGIDYIDDPSNQSNQFLRNRVRNELMPVLKRLSPAAVKVLARDALVMGEENEAVAQLLDEKLEGVVARDEDGALTVPVHALGAGPLRRLLLHRLFEKECPYPPEAVHFELLDNLLQQSAGTSYLHLPGGVRVVREYDTVRILLPYLDTTTLHGHSIGPTHTNQSGPSPGPSTPFRPDPVREASSYFPFNSKVLPCATQEFALEIPSTGSYLYPGGKIVVSTVQQEGEIPREDALTVVFDANQVVFPLILRTWKQGDRLEPLGVRGTRKVSDELIDRKIPREKRRNVLVLTNCHGTILWLVGVRRSSHWPAQAGHPMIIVRCS